MEFNGVFGTEEDESVHTLACSIFAKSCQVLDSNNIGEFMREIRIAKPVKEILKFNESVYKELFSECLSDFAKQINVLLDAFENNRFSLTKNAPNWNNAIEEARKFLDITTRAQNLSHLLFSQPSEPENGILVIITTKRVSKVLNQLENLIRLWKQLGTTYEGHFDSLQSAPAGIPPDSIFDCKHIIVPLTDKCFSLVDYLVVMTSEQKYNYFVKEITSFQKQLELCITELKWVLFCIDLHLPAQAENPHLHNDEDVEDDDSEEENSDTSADENLEGNNDETSNNISENEEEEEEEEEDVNVISEEEKSWIRLGLRTLLLLNVWVCKAIPGDRYYFRIFRNLSNSELDDLIDELDVLVDTSTMLKIHLSHHRPVYNKRGIENALNELQLSVEKASKVLLSSKPKYSGDFEGVEITENPKNKENPSRIVEHCFEEEEKEWIKCWVDQFTKVAQTFS